LSNQSPKHHLFEQFAQVAKGIGHASRFELLELLAQGERCVDDLAQVAGLTTANTSHHLQHLRRVGLIMSNKRGLYVFYRLAGDDVIDLLRALRRSTERHIAEVDRSVFGYFNERDSLEAISRKELLSRIKEGLVTVIDVRPFEEYQSGHLPGAISLPIKGLKKRLGSLPKGREVIAYCRGPYCVFAFEAVAVLRKKGFKARRMEEGYPEWKAEGLPVEANAVWS
jgi:rhodanese-related sulfurtransferase/DNA-binding transcriptional ArsR family regulator